MGQVGDEPVTPSEVSQGRGAAGDRTGDLIAAPLSSSPGCR